MPYRARLSCSILLFLTISVTACSTGQNEQAVAPTAIAQLTDKVTAILPTAHVVVAPTAAPTSSRTIAPTSVPAATSAPTPTTDPWAEYAPYTIEALRARSYGEGQIETRSEERRVG